MHGLPTRRSGRLGAVPDEVAIMAVLCLLGAGGCLLGSLLPLSDQAPVELGWIMAGVGGALGAIDLALGERLPRWALHAQLLLVTGCATLLITRSHTGSGAMTTAIALPWFGVYAAVFFSRGQAVAYATILTVGLGVGLAAAPAPVGVTSGVVVGVSLWSAVLALSTLTRRLRELASTDPLTGVLNRAGLFAAARHEMARARRSRAPLLLVAIDLDDLKAVNDAQGHQSGDRLLAASAQAWRATLRGQDVLARTGGDEFIVIAPDTDGDHAAGLVDRLRAAYPVRWSCGVSAWEHDEPFEPWLARADAALYADKAGRRADRGREALEPAA